LKYIYFLLITHFQIINTAPILRYWEQLYQIIKICKQTKKNKKKEEKKKNNKEEKIIEK
jgi:hypothetical protein